jgi:hypothetical protein
MNKYKVILVPFFAALVFFLQGIIYGFVYAYVDRIVKIGFKFWHWFVGLPSVLGLGLALMIGLPLSSSHLLKENRKLSSIITIITLVLFHGYGFYLGKNKFDDLFNTIFSCLIILTFLILVYDFMFGKDVKGNKKQNKAV